MGRVESFMMMCSLMWPPRVLGALTLLTMCKAPHPSFGWRDLFRCALQFPSALLANCITLQEMLTSGISGIRQGSFTSSFSHLLECTTSLLSFGPCSAYIKQFSPRHLYLLLEHYGKVSNKLESALQGNHPCRKLWSLIQQQGIWLNSYLVNRAEVPTIKEGFLSCMKWNGASPDNCIGGANQLRWLW